MLVADIFVMFAAVFVLLALIAATGKHPDGLRLANAIGRYLDDDKNEAGSE